MATGVFIHRPDSRYEDEPDRHYQFPRSYLSRAVQFVGDWVLYYEPVKLPRSRGYYAIAKVAEIVPDPVLPEMYRALIEPGTYLDFPTPVPFVLGDQYLETGLLNDAGKLSGRAQSAVRAISTEDFVKIINIGLQEADDILPRNRADDAVEPTVFPGFQEPRHAFDYEPERSRIAQLTIRPFRERAFRQRVLHAYQETCAFTGLRLINGGGRAEVQAAHIQSVESNGPDRVNNGLALTGTAHWMFDRGLLGLADDGTILISRQANDRDSIAGMLNPTGRVLPPKDPRDAPYKRYVDWHRENCFKN